MTKKRPEQLQVPGTEPVEPHPAIRTALDAWLAARDDAKDARQAVVNAHDVLLDAIAAAKISFYTYDEGAKRKRVFPSAEPKLKTSTVSTPKPSGRRGRERDVEMPIDKERRIAVDAIGGGLVREVDVGEEVTHRKVKRSEVVDDGDPFAATRGLLKEASERQGSAA